MAEQLFVQTKGAYLLPSGETINPGSIIQLDEETARQFVDRGLGTFSDGPVYRAPGNPGGHGYKADGTPLINRPFGYVAPTATEDQPDVQAQAPAPVERADLGERLARAEHAVARPQQ